MTAPAVDLALAETDPAAFVLAVADLREARTTAATPSPWRVHHSFFAGRTSWYVDATDDPTTMPAAHCAAEANAEHIAAEANPAHALAEVALWRSIALDMEREAYRLETGDIPYTWTACVAAARAYLAGGAS